jgi:hypothetical protein
MCSVHGNQAMPGTVVSASLPSLCQCCSRLLCHCRVAVVKVQPQYLAPHGLVTRDLHTATAATWPRQGSQLCRKTPHATLSQQLHMPLNVTLHVWRVYSVHNQFVYQSLPMTPDPCSTADSCHARRDRETQRRQQNTDSLKHSAPMHIRRSCTTHLCSQADCIPVTPKSAIVCQ